MSFRPSEGSGGISHGYDRYFSYNFYLTLTHFSLLEMYSRDIRNNNPYFVFDISLSGQ